MKRQLLTAAVGFLVLVASACGSGADADTDPDSACLAGATDCADDPTQNTNPTIDPNTDSACLVGATDCADDPTQGFDVEGARERAHGVLGVSESELPDDVRIGRIGDEHLAVTEDYQLGRLTVALEDPDDGGLRVVEVTVELPDGPETFELQAS